MENKNTPVISLSEISKVENPILNAKQLNMLLAETPKNHIYSRPAKGGGEWDYVTGVYVKKVLNMVFGWDWSFEIKQFEYNMQSKQCIVLGRLTVNVKERTIVKEQFGRSDIAFKTEYITDAAGKGKKQPSDSPLDLGNDLKAATTDALKKCASELGVASDIYGGEEFKSVRVVEYTDKDIIANLKTAISKQLSFCQDVEMNEAIRNKLLEAEAHGNNTVEFYEGILEMFI
jgi:hypothetical protein